jgi:hypothetical protein
MPKGNDGGNSDLGFFLLANALSQRDDGVGENVQNIFPEDDIADMQRGADHIPGEVTDARRMGKKVFFSTAGAQELWYWQMPNGNRIGYKT